ncbi:hypothetical protein L9F63_022475 [Diploptera punctata]|uniref:Uncharacterized protein n=1 Tax=Diploptera punctata TaxID=6984 RepID=A0AAD7ZM41_DIPPU|nr:hypothetical protein L9F63_022475 [Diploptera punctata]
MMWSIGVITLAAHGYLSYNWRHLQFAISLPTVLLIFTYPWIPDSPTWMIAKGRMDKEKKNVDEIAAFNGTKHGNLDIKFSPPTKK